MVQQPDPEKFPSLAHSQDAPKGWDAVENRHKDASPRTMAFSAFVTPDGPRGRQLRRDSLGFDELLPPQQPLEKWESASHGIGDVRPLSRSYSFQRSSLYSSRTSYGSTNPTLGLVPSSLGFMPHPAVRGFETQGRRIQDDATKHQEDQTAYPSSLPLALIVVGICLSIFLISLDRNIITTAIPRITEQFHSYEDIGWYGSAYLLTASAFQPLYGRIYTSFNIKSSFLIALSVFQIGSLICALAPNSEVLIFGRAVQGVGSAGILTGSFVVATHSVRLSARPVLFAFVGILYGVGALCGPLLGGAFTVTIGWRWCFWINLPAGAVTFVAVLFFFKPSVPTGTLKSRQSFLQRLLSLDLIGNLILLGAIVQLFLALQLSEARLSWSSAPVIGCLCGFGGTTLIFIGWIIYKKDSALLPPSILRQRTVAASAGAGFFIYATILLHAYYLPIYFQAIKNSSALESGVNMIPYMVANALFSLLAGIFVSKNGLFAPPAILGCAIGTVGCGLLATLDVNTSTATWVGYMILASGGIGIAIQQGFSAVQTALPAEQVSIGTAAVVASQSIGGAIFVSVGNTLLQNHLLSSAAQQRVPNIDLRVIIEMGTTNFRDNVPSESLPALVQLYADSLQGVFIAAVPLCGCAFLCSLCMEWRSVRKAPSKEAA